MKKLIWINLFVLGIVALYSCERIENEPRDLDSYENVFDSLDVTASRAQLFLNNIYSFLPSGFSRVGNNFLEAGTDDAVSIDPNASVSFYTNGIVSVVNNPDNYFSASYAGIRQANIFLANSGKLVVPTNNPDRTKRFNAEARFIRAFLYFELLKRYGGIPLIGDKVFTLNDNLQLKRNTFEECVNYIASECDAVKPDLFPDNIPDTDLGRIVRGAAVALKTRLFLYAASPLFNGGGIETDQGLKALTGYLNADPSRWQKVVDAVAEFKALGYYGFFNNGQTGTIGYRQLFITKKNNEVILAKQSVNNFDLENSQSPIGYVGFAAVQGGGRTNPTQNFVDAFPMIDGSPITESTSYNPQNPYVNRDPRFYATVFFTQTFSNPSGQNYNWLNRPVETFEGGRDKPNNNLNDQTRTGYYLRKFLGNFSTGTTYAQQSHNFIYFRYAEIILNNAEALNELGRVEDAVNEIIAIRRRAGINPGTNNRFGIRVGINQIDMSRLIKNERRIELSFEEHRFYDLRRWKLGNTELNKTLNGMKVTRNANGTFTFGVVPVVNITFTDKLYHNPFPFDETLRNTELKQNFGW